MEPVYTSLTAPNKGASITPGVMKNAYRFMVNSATSRATNGQIDEFKDRESRIKDQLLLLEAKFDKVLDDSKLSEDIDYFNHNMNPEIVLIGKFRTRATARRSIQEPITPVSKINHTITITDVTLTFEKDESGVPVPKTLKYSERSGARKAQRLYTLKPGITLNNLTEDDKIIMQKVGVYKGGRKTRRQNRKYRKTKKNKKRRKSQ